MTFVQLAAGFIVTLGGAWLIGWWAVGIVLVLTGVLIIADALLKDDDRPDRKHQLHDEVLERWRRAR
jgi:hypothetical protein